MNKLTKITIAIVAVLSLGACASNRGYQQPQYQNSNQQGVRYGTVQNITVSNNGGSQTSGGGALLGAIVGGVVGNRFGGGTGKDLSTVAGAFGGAIVGNEIEKNKSQAGPTVYNVQVRFDDGGTANYQYGQINGIGQGSRVKLVNGRLLTN